MNEFASVIFLRPEECLASVEVSGHWDRPLLDLLIESETPRYRWGDPDETCQHFLKWLYTQSPVPGTFYCNSLPGIAGILNTEWDTWEWYDRLMLNCAVREYPLILVDLDQCHVIYQGKIIWPFPEDRPRRRRDPRLLMPGAPFPMGWTGRRLGDFRLGHQMFNKYSPEDMPPISVPITGSLDWLAEAPVHSESIGINKRVAAHLELLLNSQSIKLPDDFVRFFQTPTLWNRIRPNNYYFNLSASVCNINNKIGSLIRFMSEEQDCLSWHLYISPKSKRHFVVTTNSPSGDDAGTVYPGDITQAATTFEEFLYRLWIENEIHFAFMGRGEMPKGGDEYLAFYSTHK